MPPRIPEFILRQLRNDIPVSFVITQILHLPYKYSENYLRFLCPKCKEFRTAIKKDTNLARCFLCKQNFNPIDIVIAVKSSSFRDAVDLLLPFLPLYNKQKSV